MTDLLRQEIAAAAHTVVVKVGTRVLTHDSGRLNEPRIEQLAEQLRRLQQQGRKVVLVSSGAVGAGMSQLNLAKRPTDLAKLQAVAAIGQAHLIEIYDRVFRRRDGHAAQVLLVAEDLQERSRYLNIRNTLLSLLDYQAVPIINENDTVSVEELMTTFGDNDRLAALVANLLHAPLLVILSDVAGLYNGNPDEPHTHVIPTVSQFDEALFEMVRDRRTGHSKGGMGSKLNAARMVTAAGENVIIASGRQENVLLELFEGKPHGTLFIAQGKTVNSRRRWIGFSASPKGRLHLDDGACQAIVSQGRSLLAIGVHDVEGEFRKGDVVVLCDPKRREVARGLTNYSREEVQKIRGLSSEKISQVLGHCPYVEVVHRDNLAVWE